MVLERRAPAAPTSGGSEVRTLADGLSDDMSAPPDQRLNRLFDHGDASAALQIGPRANFYVIAHVDITPQDRAGIEQSLLRFAHAARRIDGNLSFQVLQQTNRPNHFNLVSAWVGEAPYRTLVASAPGREFRQAIGQYLGSPYDDRFFRRVD